MDFLKLKGTAEQIELIKALASNNRETAMKAHDAFAAFISPVIKEALLTLGTASRIYRDIEFDEDSDPSIPLDLFYDQGDGYVTVWSQNVAGGLPTSQVTGVAEMKFSTYRLDSAVSINKKYARKSRLDVVAKAIERMLNSMLIKQERNAWSVVLKGIAEASTTPVGGTALKHVIGSKTASYFTLADMNALMTRVQRINESYSGNTPINAYSNGFTDLFVSPEIKEQIRAFAYNPINTTGAPATTAPYLDQTLPENIREEIYRQAGMSSIFGVNIQTLVELGISKKYNTLFGTWTAANSIVAGGGGGSFSTAADELLVAVDNTRGALVRPVARQAESGGTVTTIPDLQWDGFGPRVEKMGWYTFLEEGRVLLDSRAVGGLVV